MTVFDWSCLFDFVLMCTNQGVGRSFSGFDWAAAFTIHTLTENEQYLKTLERRIKSGKRWEKSALTRH